MQQYVVDNASPAPQSRTGSERSGADATTLPLRTSLRDAASRSRQELDRLVDLLSILRSPHDAEPIRYGCVRYEGVLYVVSKNLELIGDTPVVDAGALFRGIADHGGRSRYGTLGKATWYGALDPFTAIAEASYHALMDGDACASEEVLGAMYQLRVRGRFVDLHGRERAQPEIVADDYTSTQALAREVRTATAFAGVLYPSARSNGTCLAVFARQALRSATFVDVVPMRRTALASIKVRPPWSATWWRLRLDDLRRIPMARIVCA